MLQDISTTEKEPTREGARLHIILAPVPSKSKPVEAPKEEVRTLENAKT
jgi:hypothetical protein